MHRSLFTYAVLSILLFIGISSAATRERVIYSFHASASQPWAPVVSDAAGNLFGVAQGIQCPPACGEVFELSPMAGSGYQIKSLHVFRSRNGDGTAPLGGLTLDSSGNLFGTTSFGGAHNAGVVFELSPNPTGWSYSVLYNFAGVPTDGRDSRASMIFDSAGNLYGTTYNGGTYDNGTVFELSPSPTGWTEKVIHEFGGPNEGAYPQASLTLDSAGNLYGTTSGGGNPACYPGCGTVFQLTNSGGTWTETQIKLFDGYPSDGNRPEGPVIFGKDGALYGTTNEGGASLNCNPLEGCGTVFQLVPSAGTWTENILYTFDGSPDGAYPNGITFDRAGNLFGTTYKGGDSRCTPYGCGTVFELSPSGGGWSESLLYPFFPNNADGILPLSGLIVGKGGVLYGTTAAGGVRGEGTVFGIQP